MSLYQRHAEESIREALGHFRVVVLHGARQCGKSTLARLVAAERGGTYTTLDADATRQAALTDPLGFLLDQPHPLVIDEIQLGGDRVVRAIKQAVDADPTPGRFLLTGSTNFLSVPTISESLAGRVRLLRLSPLSQAELNSAPAPDVAAWFEPERIRTVAEPAAGSLSRRDYLELLSRGGYPEALALPEARRGDWFETYAETVVERDVVALGDLRRRTLLPRLLEWTAAGTAGELNVTAASSRLGVDRATLDSYLRWLETVFLVQRLPSWSRNLTARPVRRPKIHVCDTGLACGLLGIDAAGLMPPTSTVTGPLLESFVVNEIARALPTAAGRLRMHHYRDHQGHEVDIIIGRADGALVAVEVKATSSPSAAQLRNVAWLRDRLDAVAPGAFRAGMLLHTGHQHLTIGDRLHVRPISTLWR